MTLTEVVIGWILGVASTIITPLIIEPVKKWQDKRNLKKSLEGDILLQMISLLAVKKIITSSLRCETMDDAIDELKKEDYNELIQGILKGHKSSLEFYNKNYERFLYYFKDELVFYESAKYLNFFIDMIEERVENGKNPKDALIAYCENLEKIIKKGEDILRNLSPLSYDKLWMIKSSIESYHDD